MKLLLLIAFFAAGCSMAPTHSEIARQNIEEYLKKSLHDPESYEFVEMGELDTTFKADHYKKLVTEYSKMLDGMGNYPEKIEEAKKRAAEFRGYGRELLAKRDDDLVADMQKMMDETNSNLKKFTDSLDISKDGDILEIKTTFTCRANNAVGAKNLTRYLVSLRPNLEVDLIEPEE